MKFFKRLIACGLTLAMVMGLAACGSSTAMIVNNEKISQGIMDFYYAYGAMQFAYYGIDISQEGYDSYRAAVEEQAVEIAKESAVIRAAAKERGLSYDEAQLDTMVEEEISALGGEDAYKEWLDEYGITEDDVRWILETQLYTEVLYADLNADLGASDAEIQAEYEKHPEEYDKISVSHILISPEDTENDADWETAKTEAEAVIDRLDAGEDFATVAAEVSDDSSASSGGALMTEFTATNNSYVEEFAAAAFTLKNVGDYSAEPVKSEYGYHIIKLDTKVTGWENLREDIDYALTGEEKDERYYDFITEELANVEIQQDYVRQYELAETDDGTADGGTAE